MSEQFRSVTSLWTRLKTVTAVWHDTFQLGHKLTAMPRTNTALRDVNSKNTIDDQPVYSVIIISRK